MLSIAALSCEYPGDLTISLPGLKIEEGTPAALCGVSGSGKSTLLECIGLLNGNAGFGEYKLGDTDVLKLEGAARERFAKASIGFMPQREGLVDFLSVKDNFALQLKLGFKAAGKRLSRDEAQERLEKLCALSEDLGVGGRLLDAFPQALSIGQRQRASLVRALSHEPRLLLIDEPTSALDPKNAALLFSLIKDYTRAHKLLTLVVSHDIEHLGGFVVYSYDKEQSGPLLSVFGGPHAL